LSAASRSKLNSILVFDDIGWSREMEPAWKTMKNHAAGTRNIDLFLQVLFF